jgi:hypothetical protein
MQSNTLPPSYEQSEQDAREEAAEAMRVDNGMPPTYEMSARDRGYNDMNVRMQREIEIQENYGAEAPPPPTTEDLQRWYLQDLNEQQRTRLQVQYMNTLADDARYAALSARIKNERLRKQLAERRDYAYRCRSTGYYTVQPTLDDFLLMQFMLRDMPILIDFTWRMNFFVLQSVYHVGQVVGPAAYHLVAAGVKGIGSLFSSHHGSSGSSNNSNEAGAIIAAIAAIFAFLLTAGIAAFAAMYSLQKTAASFANLFNRRKLFRSIIRITATLAGAVAGIHGGMILGSALGSLIPGLGTIAGAIIGAILGTCIMSCVGSMTSKFLMRFISELFNSNEINPTNPGKYKLNQQQRDIMNSSGIHTRTIDNMMRAIKHSKPEKSIVWLSKENRQKNVINLEYNELLRAVKTNPAVVERGFYLTKNSLFRFNDRHWEHVAIQRPPAFNPQYQA